MGNSLASYLASVPDQTGKVVVITGANSGLGLETSVVLAGKGATVVMACRNKSKAEDARQVVVARAKCPAQRVVLATLDLASLESVRAFRGEYVAAVGGELPIDVFIANAGIMALPERQSTSDGFEAQMGTNCFGHFALLAELLGLIKSARASRVVFLSSGAHQLASTISFDDLDRRKRYDPWTTYSEASRHWRLRLRSPPRCRPSSSATI